MKTLSLLALSLFAASAVACASPQTNATTPVVGEAAPDVATPAPEKLDYSPVPPDGVNVVATIDEQLAMQRAILARLDRRYVRRVVHTQQGQIIDCIDWNKQPSCAGGGCGDAPPTPPSAPSPPRGARAPTGGPNGEPGVVVQAHVEAPSCPAGTVGIVRPSIEAMRRYHTAEAWEAAVRDTKRGSLP